MKKLQHQDDSRIHSFSPNEEEMKPSWEGRHHHDHFNMGPREHHHRHHSQDRDEYYQPRYKKVHQLGMKDFTAWLDQENAHTAKYTAKYYIDIAFALMFVWMVAAIGFFQYSLIFCILMVIKHQETIEKRFMGPALRQVNSN